MEFFLRLLKLRNIKISIVNTIFLLALTDSLSNIFEAVDEK